MLKEALIMGIKNRISWVHVAWDWYGKNDQLGGFELLNTGTHLTCMYHRETKGCFWKLLFHNVCTTYLLYIL